MKEKIKQKLKEARLNKWTQDEKEDWEKRGFKKSDIEQHQPKDFRKKIKDLPSVYIFNASYEPTVFDTDENGEEIYKKKLNIERFIKLDPMNKNNSSLIGSMLIRAQVQPKLKTYVITTTPDLLDDLVGKGGDDIDDFFLKIIKDNMVPFNDYRKR